jgi:hypothetical protein
MNKHLYLLVKPLKDKSIVWFENSNTYVLVAHETAIIIKQYFKDPNQLNLGNWIKERFNLSKKDSEVVLKPILSLIKQLHLTKNNTVEENTSFKVASAPKTIKYYNINNTNFKVSYQTESLSFLIHPKFTHLEDKTTTNHQHHFEVFLNGDKIVLNVNGNFEGSWSEDEFHYFQGKFSMKLVEKLYNKPESDWLGVFHASAISNGHQNILFLGDSGNGKSTLAALLVSQGYTLFADDFVPVEAKTQHVHYFPAAISIKEKALDTLSPLFPQLRDSPQIDLKYINKSVRYLVAPELETTFENHLLCKKLVFVKYQKESNTKLNELSSEEAFERLIPDSWISPLSENAAFFMDWFATLSCYSLTYSNNEEMYKYIKKLYKDDL